MYTSITQYVHRYLREEESHTLSCSCKNISLSVQRFCRVDLHQVNGETNTQATPPWKWPIREKKRSGSQTVGLLLLSDWPLHACLTVYLMKYRTVCMIPLLSPACARSPTYLTTICFEGVHWPFQCFTQVFQSAYRNIQAYTGPGLPAVGSTDSRRFQLLQTLLEKFFVLVDEVFLHLGHLSHDLLSAETSHLCLPLPLCLVSVSQRLRTWQVCSPAAAAQCNSGVLVLYLLRAMSMTCADCGYGRCSFSHCFNVRHCLETKTGTTRECL